MPVSIVCNSCEKKMIVADEFAGKRGRCPQCNNVIAVPEPNIHADEMRMPPRDGKAVSTSRRTVKQEKKVVGDERDEGEKDEQEGRTFKDRATKWVGGNKKLLLLGGVGVGGAGLALSGGLLLLAYFLHWWPFGASLDAELKYLPDDTTWIISERTEQVRKTKHYQAKKERDRERQAKKGKETDTEHGVKDADIERITSAIAKDGTITIITSKKSVKGDEVKEGLKNRSGSPSSPLEYTEEAIGSYKLYVRKKTNEATEADWESTSFCIPESKILLLGKAEIIRKILQRNKKPDLSAGLKKAVAVADFSNSFVWIISSADEEKAKEKAGPDDLKEVESICMEINYDTEVTFKISYFCKDAAGAETVLTKLDERNKKEKAKESESDKEQRKNCKMSKEGSKVVETSHVKEQTLIDEIKKEK